MKFSRLSNPRLQQTPSYNGADTGFNVTGTRVSPRPTGASLRERMENTLNGESQESWRWFDHLAERPLLWLVQSLVPSMIVSQRLLGCVEQPGSIKGSAFEVLEPYAGKLARTVLRGAEGSVRGPWLLGGDRRNNWHIQITRRIFSQRILM